jgi:hypothetical protein
MEKRDKYLYLLTSYDNVIIKSIDIAHNENEETT